MYYKQNCIVLIFPIPLQSSRNRGKGRTSKKLPTEQSLSRKQMKHNVLVFFFFLSITVLKHSTNIQYKNDLFKMMISTSTHSNLKLYQFITH